MASRQVRPLPRAPRPRTEGKPRLRIIPGGAGSAAVAPKPVSIPIGRSTVAFAVAVVATAAAFIFGLVLLNIYSAQSSFTLAEVQSNVLQEEAKYRRMRFEVAKAESPDAVAQVAAQLGLAPPAEQEYLSGPSTDSGGSQLLARQP